MTITKLVNYAVTELGIKEEDITQVRIDSKRIGTVWVTKQDLSLVMIEIEICNPEFVVMEMTWRDKDCNYLDSTRTQIKW